MYYMKTLNRRLCLAVVVLIFVMSPNLNAGSTIYVQTNLVSDVPGVANVTDPNLKNSWGMAFSPTSPFWVSNQASGLATLYDGAGNIIPLVVTIPSIGFPPGPTGQVFNGTSDFNLPDGSPARFLFDTLDSQILGWNSGAGTTAVNVATTPGAIYTGLAAGNAAGSNYLYAADNTGLIWVFDKNFKDVTFTTFAGKFVDPSAIPGFNPFNIQNIGGNLYVTYAMVNNMGVGLPGGFVDEYDTSGNFIKRIATMGNLYAPWGITIAPARFGQFSGDLLIGQFGNGEIYAYDPVTNAFLGTLNGRNGQPLDNPFLWALDFRTGGPNTNPYSLYFTAGYNNQLDGLFGEIAPAPEPGTISLLLTVIGSFGVRQLLKRT